MRREGISRDLSESARDQSGMSMDDQGFRTIFAPLCTVLIRELDGATGE